MDKYPLIVLDEELNKYLVIEQLETYNVVAGRFPNKNNAIIFKKALVEKYEKEMDE